MSGGTLDLCPSSGLPVTVSVYIAVILGICIVTVLVAKETANAKLEDVRPNSGIEKGKS